MQKLKVIALETKSGNAAKSGKPYTMTVAKCVLEGEDGSLDVGEAILPKDHPVITPGVYTAELQLAKGMNGSISGQIVRLTPFVEAVKAMPKAA